MSPRGFSVLPVTLSHVWVALLSSLSSLLSPLSSPFSPPSFLFSPSSSLLPLLTAAVLPSLMLGKPPDPLHFCGQCSHSSAGQPISDFRTCTGRPDHLAVLRGSGQYYGVPMKLQ